MKRSFLLLAALAVLAGAAYYFCPPVRDWTLAVTGRGNGCIPQRAFDIHREKKELTRLKDEILYKTTLLQKEFKSYELYQTPYGQFWTPAGSRFLLPFNLAEQAAKIYGTGPQYIQPGDIVLDCGANVGTFVRFALDAGAGTVVAIEPAPDNLECLRRNFPKEIAAGRVIVYPKGVWDKDDTLELLVDPDNQAADSFVIHRQGAKAVAKVPLTTIDDLVYELNLKTVNFVKMDIEGAEVKALQGGRQTLARFHPRLALSVYHQPDHPVEVPKAARAAWSGYSLECGPCNEVPGAVRPDVFYMR